ncbi:hypothetical protein ABWL39_02715 [Chitinivorax sp. PXF-14]|uniref:hypothetical protein n=1 Tax=Chitinivorax sp. PXF-14 TaxID=3230488 RepID=UPI0034657265
MIRRGILLVGFLLSAAVSAEELGQNERAQFAKQIINEVHVTDLYARIAGQWVSQFASVGEKIAQQAATKPEDRAKLTSVLELALIKSAQSRFIDAPTAQAEASLATSPALTSLKDYQWLKSFVESSLGKKLVQLILFGSADEASNLAEHRSGVGSKSFEQRQAEMIAAFTPQEAADWKVLNTSPERQRLAGTLFNTVLSGMKADQGKTPEDKKVAWRRNANRIICDALNDVKTDGYSLDQSAFEHFCTAS